MNLPQVYICSPSWTLLPPPSPFHPYGSSQQFSYLSSKWFVKQCRQLVTSTTHLTQDLLMNIQWGGGSRSFAKEMRALTMRSIVAGHWKLTTTVERITEADPLTSTQEVAQELSVDHLTVVWHLRQIGNVKKLNKWADCKSKKSSFWSVIFSYSVQQQWTISQ